MHHRGRTKRTIFEDIYKSPLITYYEMKYVVVTSESGDLMFYCPAPAYGAWLGIPLPYLTFHSTNITNSNAWVNRV